MTADKRTKKRSWSKSFKRLFGTAFAIAEEHYSYRRQVVQLAATDIVKTYRGSALGWMWAIIKPVVTVFVFWFAFAIGLRHSKDVAGYPFFLWLVSGIIPWFYMNEMLTQGSTTLKRYDYLVTKIKFPVSTISTFVSLSKFYVHMALLAVVVLIFTLSGHPIDIYFLQLPFYMLMMFIFWTAWSLFASPLSAVSKDFANVINSFITAIFWMSGIMWDADRIKTVWLKRLLMFNPVTYFAHGYRNVFIYKRWFWQDHFASGAFAFILIGMLVLSVYTYHRLRREIADFL